jgi:tetratricopeptide (TPR) repeat protein
LRQAPRRGELARLFADRIQAHRAGDGDPLGFLFPEARYGGPTIVAARISAYEGTCCLRAGDLDDAERAFNAVLTTLPADSIQGQRAFVLADLAAVSIRCGEIEGACKQLEEALDLAERTGARMPLRRIQRARRELTPWADSRAVHDLDEKLFGPLDL